MRKSPHILQLPKIRDPRGNLTFLQHADQLPFVIQRVFWTYDVASGEVRGGHAYRTQEEVVIALSGSFDVVVQLPDQEEQRFFMNRSSIALYLPPLTWRHIESFSTNAVSLHLSSKVFDDRDYIRNFDAYRELAQ